MKSRYKKIMLSALTAMLCIAVLIAGFFYITPKSAKAAMSIDTSKVNLIYDRSGGFANLDTSDGGIDKFVLQNLFQRLVGDNEKPTLENVVKQANTDIVSQAAGGNEVYKGLTSKQISNIAGNNGKDLVLKFGGLTWTAVYLTLDKNSEPVLTLLLQDSSQLTTTHSKFSVFSPGASNTEQTNVNYPASRYSTSALRAALNLGTFKAISNANAEVVSQNANDKLAIFTMTDDQLKEGGSSSKSLMKYIDMPYLIDYQQTQSWIKLVRLTGSNTINMPNDAYGVPDNGEAGWSFSGCAYNERGICTGKSGGANFDYNSYVLHNYIVNETQDGTMSLVTNNYKNDQVKNNMDLSSIFNGKLYDASQSQGDKWKRPSEWNDNTEFYEKTREWIDAESWAFDPVWVPGYQDIYTTDAKTLWRCSANQISYNSNYWLRTGGDQNANLAYARTAAGAYTNGLFSNNADYHIRPALHLNLAAAAAAAGHLPYDKPTMPTTKSVDYDGTEQSLEVPNLLDATYEEADGFNGTYDGANFKIKATEAGEYKLTVKLPDDGVWKDGTKDSIDYTLTINPAEIKVNFDDGGSDETKKKNREYIYDENTTHRLEISKNVVELVAQSANEDSIKIYYQMTKHDEKIDPSAHDSVTSSPPDINDVGEKVWSETVPEAKDPGGYCVWFKIVADNHKVYYGTDGAGADSYISVHIFTEVLTIKVEEHDLGNYNFGEINTTDYTNLGKLLQKGDGSPKYTIEYPEGSKAQDDLNGDDIVFTLKKDGKTAQPDAKGRYSAGDYTLNAEWKDPDGKHFVSFKWNDDTPPKVTIKPLPVTVTWKGENDSDSDFEWEYDGNPHAPTAYFKDLDGTEHKLTIDESFILTDVDDEVMQIDEAACAAAYPDYDFSNATTQAYKIIPTPNSWIKESFKVPDWATCGDPPAISSLPRAKYGTVVIKYYSDSDCTAEVTLVKGMTPGTYYARAEVAAEDNFGGIIGEPVEFTVKDHTYVLVPKDENGHYGRCSVCGTENATTGHSFTQHIKNATCTEDGYTSEDCECGFSKIDESTREKARGHNMSNHYPAKQATATTDGNIEYFECGVCHKYFKDIQGNEEVAIENTVIPATGAITPPEGGSGDGGGGSGTGDNTGGSGAGGQSGNTGESGTGDGTGDGGSGSGSGSGGSGSGSGSGSTGGDESSVNPPLGGDTGLSGSGSSSDINAFFRDNWWWMVLIAALIIAIILTISLINSARRRREKREADEKFDKLLKLQMMQNYGGFATYQAPADDGGAAIEGQPAPAQLPFNQDMFNAAISAAVSSAMTAAMQAMKNGEFPMGQSDSTPDNPDVDGFYDDVEDPDNPTGNGQ